MLNLAVTEQDCVELADVNSYLNENERRLIARFRQMREYERQQVRRLIEQLANNPDDTDS